MSIHIDPGVPTLPPDLASRLHDQYEQICTSYHAIEDQRAKLLGFLPLASAGGIFFLLADPFTSQDKLAVIKPYLVPIGVLGVLITLGLFLYDLRETQLSGALRKNGKDIEQLLGIQWQGQFSTRPQGKMYVINSGVGVSLIYAAIISGWVFLAFISSPLPNAPLIGGALILVFFFMALFIRLAHHYEWLPSVLRWLAPMLRSKTKMNQLIPLEELPMRLEALFQAPVDTVIVEQHQGKLVIRPATRARTQEPAK